MKTRILCSNQDEIFEFNKITSWQKKSHLVVIVVHGPCIYECKFNIEYIQKISGGNVQQKTSVSSKKYSYTLLIKHFKKKVKKIFLLCKCNPIELIAILRKVYN